MEQIIGAVARGADRRRGEKIDGARRPAGHEKRARRPFLGSIRSVAIAATRLLLLAVFLAVWEVL
ncbi:hypothetical protein, partial [Ramlibacter ginsenosidimutans]|uniref:hypothetical protein n=1 Tax=Ramlibacter ginsenosidimutans TaxID=502333 RepID=UPI00362A9AE8